MNRFGSTLVTHQAVQYYTRHFSHRCSITHTILVAPPSCSSAITLYILIQAILMLVFSRAHPGYKLPAGNASTLVLDVWFSSHHHLQQGSLWYTYIVHLFSSLYSCWPVGSIILSVYSTSTTGTCSITGCACNQGNCER